MPADVSGSTPPASDPADPAASTWAGLPTPDGLPAEVPDFTLVHFSDTHLTPLGTLYNAVIDADEALRSVVAEISRAVTNGYRIDAIVASGDLTDTGDPDAYRRLDAQLKALGAPIIYATGNHDVRKVFHRELLGIDNAGASTGRDFAAPDPQIVQQHWIDGRLRVVVLDSTVVEAGNGRFEDATLTELSAILATPAPAGTVVVLHHAPIPPPTPLLVYFTLERAARQQLAERIANTDVRLILAGHHHIAQSGVLAGVQVAVAGSAAIRTDPIGPPGHERTTRSKSFNLVRIYPDTVTVTVIPVDDAGEVFHLDEEGCADVIARFPAR
jgi:3',5'-cyclic-AMP phosphodiesterase